MCFPWSFRTENIIRPLTFGFFIKFSDIYGNVTFGQIKDGKHMHRALEAHCALHLALYKLYISAFVEKNQVIERELKEAVIEAVTEAREYQVLNKDIIK